MIERVNTYELAKRDDISDDLNEAKPASPSHRVLLGLLIALSLIGAGAVVDWQRLSTDGLEGALNDQVGYISAARHLAGTGKLESAIIFPSVLRQQARRNTLYMPGFYWALALAYKCFGYSALVSRIPSLISFLLACWVTYWIATRLYSKRAGCYGCALFAFFPICLVLAFTAMSEMAVVAAGLASFAIFLWAREESRIWVGPVALLLAIVFRETGAVIGVIMVAVLIGGAREIRLRRGAICAVLMLLVLAFALISPIGSGRPSLWKANILGGGNPELLYADAYGADRLPSHLADWRAAVKTKFKGNLHALGYSGTDKPEGSGERLAVYFILTGIPLGFWLWLRKRDHFALGVSAALSLLLMADLCLYTVWGYRGLRVLLTLLPFVAILWGAALDRLVGARRYLFAAVLIACCLLGTGLAMRVIHSQSNDNAYAQECTALLESVGVDNRRLLVSPFWLSLDYVNQHYPVKWAFIPSNCQTMRLLDERYPIGMLVLPIEPETPEELKQNSVCGMRLDFAGERDFHGTTLRIFRRQARE